MSPKKVKGFNIGLTHGRVLNYGFKPGLRFYVGLSHRGKV